MASDQSFLRYRRLRAPHADGSVLHDPLATEMRSVWAVNLNRSTIAGGDDSGYLRQASSRGEITRAAIEYSRHHRNVDFVNSRTNQVVMAGHQPNLFHPGVWYKNFVISRLGREFEALPINLIVDNDICTSTSINIPVESDQAYTIRRVHFDHGGAIIPFEERAILDRQTFSQFGRTATKIIRPVVQSPIVERLWPLVLENRSADRLGYALAAGRHAYEASLGIDTLELPVSAMCQTVAFAQFVLAIFSDFTRFVGVYNRAADEYRAIHGVRSRAHPVPNLQISRGEFSETPFWFWTGPDPRRTSLLMKGVGSGFQLLTPQQDRLWLSQKDFVSDFLSLAKRGIRVRPKALMTTLFSRLVGCDLFVHGIGGAKYDQLTDQIAHDFFGLRLPHYATVTATMQLPSQVPLVSPAEIAEIDTRLRQMKYHPEAHSNSLPPESQHWVQLKRRLISQVLPKGKRRQRHDGITECNRQLQVFLSDQRQALQANRAELAKMLPSSQLVNSRETSFCLFPESLAEQLRQLAIHHAIQ